MTMLVVLATIIAVAFTSTIPADSICVHIELTSDLDTPDWMIIEGAHSVDSMAPVANMTTNCNHMRWGSLGATVWSRDECSGTFLVCYSPIYEADCIEDTLGDEDGATETSRVVEEAGQIGSMTVLENLSGAPCQPKVNFRYDGNVAHTWGGCKARFQICYLPGPPLLCRVLHSKHHDNNVTYPGVTMKHVFPLWDKPDLQCDPIGWIIDGSTVSIPNECSGYFLICFEPAQCHARGFGDPHIETGDGGKIRVNSNCMYQLTGTIFESLCSFKILSKMESRKIANITWFQFIEVHVDNRTIRVGSDCIVYVNDVPVALDYSKDGVCISKTNETVKIVLPCGVTVKWAWVNNKEGRVWVWIPKVYATWVRGLFGNCNYDKLDDLLDEEGNSLKSYLPDRAAGNAAVALVHVVEDTSDNPSTLPECQVPQ